MISTEDYLYFLDQTLDGMLEIIARLGDDHVNQRLDLPSVNSPYAILTHCLGVMDYWAAHVVAGRDVRRDRDARIPGSRDHRRPARPGTPSPPATEVGPVEP